MAGHVPVIAQGRVHYRRGHFRRRWSDGRRASVACFAEETQTVARARFQNRKRRKHNSAHRRRRRATRTQDIDCLDKELPPANERDEI